jgi:branched-chain amino acid transport system permease protein
VLLQQLLNGLVTGCIYVIFALGFTLVFGVNRVLNLAHGTVCTWGALIGLVAVSPQAIFGDGAASFLPLPLAIVVAVIGAGLVAVLLDFVAFRPLRKRKASEFSALVSSIGASFILLSLAQQFTHTAILRFPFGAFPIHLYRFAGLRLSLLQGVTVACAAVLPLALGFYLYRTHAGRQVRAVAISEKTARLLGVNPTLVHMQVFFLSGALAGFAGVLIGLAFNSVNFMMGESYLLRSFVVVVLGGLGSISGAVVAGLILGVVQTLTDVYVSTGLSDAIIFSLLFVILLVRPTGLFRGLQRDARVVRA